MRKKVKIVFLHSSRYTVYWRRRRKPFGDWGSRDPGSSARMFFIRRVSIKIWTILRDGTQCRWILGFLICWSEFKIYLTADSNFYIYIYTFLYLLTQFLGKNPGEPGAKKNSKKEKAKNWLIKSIEKSIQGMERILKSFREMIKLKIFKKWLNCCKLCKIVAGKYNCSVCLWPHVVYFFINSLHYVWSWSAVPVWRCGCRLQVMRWSSDTDTCDPASVTLRSRPPLVAASVSTHAGIFASLKVHNHRAFRPSPGWKRLLMLPHLRH